MRSIASLCREHPYQQRPSLWTKEADYIVIPVPCVSVAKETSYTGKRDLLHWHTNKTDLLFPAYENALIRGGVLLYKTDLLFPAYENALIRGGVLLFPAYLCHLLIASTIGLFCSTPPPINAFSSYLCHLLIASTIGLFCKVVRLLLLMRSRHTCAIYSSLAPLPNRSPEP